MGVLLSLKIGEEDCKGEEVITVLTTEISVFTFRFDVSANSITYHSSRWLIFGLGIHI